MQRDPKQSEPEAWKEVVGFPGYEVSCLGRVRSWRPPNGRDPAKRARMMTLRVDKDGYLRVNLRHPTEDRQVYRPVHRLVLDAFVGPCPPGMECRHYPDRTRTNCRLGNLQWDTPKNNHADKHFHGTMAMGERHGSRTKPESVGVGVRNGRALVDDRDVCAIRSRMDRGESARRIATDYGLGTTQVRRIGYREQWRHVAEAVSCNG